MKQSRDRTLTERPTVRSTGIPTRSLGWSVVRVFWRENEWQRAFCESYTGSQLRTKNIYILVTKSGAPLLRLAKSIYEGSKFYWIKITMPNLETTSVVLVLTLESSALLSFYGGNLTLFNLFDTKFQCPFFHQPGTTVYSESQPNSTITLELYQFP